MLKFDKHDPMQMRECRECGKRTYTLFRVAGRDFCAFCVRDMKPIKCPHGNAPAECDACFVESDIAYDSWRETR